MQWYLDKIGLAKTGDLSNDLADIRPVIFLRFGKIITTDEILPKWEPRWYRGDHHNISGRFP